MDCDSDSELQATDTLRIDSESEDDDNTTTHQTEPSNGDNILKSNMTDNDVKELSISQAVLENTHPEAIQNDIEDRMPGLQHRRSKVSKIIDSDSEDEKLEKSTVEPVKTPTEAPNLDAMNRLSSLLDSDSNSDQDGTPIRNTKQTKKLKKKKVIKSGGTVREREDLEDELQTSKAIPSKKEVKSKHKKSTAMKRPSSPVTSANDILASLNLFFGDEDEPPGDMKYTHNTANSMLEDESNASRSREPSPVRKQMTGNEATEERQTIQSESQRMAREAYIDVPYHRTKAYSLEEFLARKTIRKPDPNRDCLGKSTDLSIKMTPEQLEAFARQLKERELESQEFFKSESEFSDEEPPKPGEVDESMTVGMETKNEMADNSLRIEEVERDPQEKEVIPDSCVTEQRVDDPIDEIVNQTSEDMAKLISDYNENNPCPKETGNESEIKYDLITADPKEAAIAAKKASLVEKFHLAPCPRLSGSSDMMIDLESGSLQPKELSGADILFQRLAKCSGSARKPTPSKSTISILSTDDGVVKLDTVSLFHKEERPLVAKEPVPGAAFLKLKQALKEKINNDRRAAMQKREEEFAKKREMEKAEMGYVSDEGVEELSDDEDDDYECEENEDAGNSDVAGQQKELFNDEAMEDGDEQNQDAGTSESSVSSDESELSDNEEETGMRKRGRIIKAFEDSDDEKNSAQHHKEGAADETQMLKDLQDNEQTKQISSPQNEQDVENITLLWKSSEEEEQQDDDLMALCSGRFATQLPSESNHPEATHMDVSTTENCTKAEEKESLFATNTLYTQGEQCIRDSQLMELCSGRFDTTQPSAPEEAATQATFVTNEASFKDDELKASPGETTAGGRRLFLDSSDEEVDSNREDVSKRSKKRKKRRRINLSDHEDEHSDVDPPINDHSDGEELDEDQVAEQPSESAENEEMERFVDYDSEENEVEVVLSKKDKKKILANFVENEAELSESEWGSADEDEKGLDRYDIEVGDKEQFDQKQLQQELEKIHNRQMLDQDNREVEQLKEIFLKDEENDGVGRVRQFRWKNVEKTFNLDYDKQRNGENDGEGAEASDEENELVWRKLRHERNILLKEKNIDLTATNLGATSLLNSDASIADVEANEDNQSFGSISAAGKRKITVVKKPITATVAKDERSFLISNSNTVQGHKASFLSRDEETLNKLANLIKSNPENEGTATATAGKARNFVFASLTPANEKSSKRLLDAEDDEHAATKKAKTAKKETTSKKTILLDALM